VLQVGKIEEYKVQEDLLQVRKCEWVTVFIVMSKLRGVCRSSGTNISLVHYRHINRIVLPQPFGRTVLSSITWLS
jgi:hypothetical protein